MLGNDYMKDYEFKESDLPKLKKTTKPKTVKKKHHFRRWVWGVILACSLIVLGYSGFKIITWQKENKAVAKQMQEIENITPITEIEDNADDENIVPEVVNPPAEEDKNNDYWQYIKLPLMSVDFTKLKAKNNDTVAFLSVGGTNINYPVVQTTDNRFYLKHSFDKTENSAGWVFMDYRNDAHNLQDNTIIYAHGRANSTMFGSLKNIFKSSWYQNTDNYIINLSTEAENTLWQVISVYQIPTETYYLTSSFGTPESFQKFLDTIVGRSKYNFNASVTTEDKILTLSTCYNKTDKVVLHAKLIKKQAR